MIKTAVITVSSSRVISNDISGRRVKEFCESKDMEVVFYGIVHDDKREIKKSLLSSVMEYGAEIILTVGGTGLGPYDLTPEATKELLEKEVPGISEHIRSIGVRNQSRAILSRGIAGIYKNALIINLPGSPEGASESLKAVFDVLTHAVDMINGKGH